MRTRVAAAIVAALVALLCVPGAVGTGQAVTGVVRVAISGALGAPGGTSADGRVTLRIGVGLPVFAVSDGGAVIAGSIATATFAQWTDTQPSAGFGPSSTLMVFHLPGGVMVVAAGVEIPGGFATTFSATSPAQTLSGTWTMASGAGVPGASASDAVVTFAFDTNPTITTSGTVSFVAGGAVTSLVTEPIPGVASVDVLRNTPVFLVLTNAKGPQVGTLASHSAYNIAGQGSEFVELKAIHFGGNLYVLYGCAFPAPASSIACLAGGRGAALHLSGQVDQVAGGFTNIAGVTPADLVLRLTGSLP